MHTLGHARTREDMSSTRSCREKRQILEGIGPTPPAEAQIVGYMTHHLPTHLRTIDAPVVLAVAVAAPPQAREGRRKQRVRLEPAHVEIEGAVREVGVGAGDELANLMVPNWELERASVVELDAALRCRSRMARS